MPKIRLETLLVHGATALLCACTLAAQAQDTEVGTDAPASTQGSQIVFESRSPGLSGGGLTMTSNAFPGHSFRLLERTEITALGGGNLRSFSAQSIFGALYQVSTPETTPDVVDDSRLLGTTLLQVPAGDPSDIAGSLSLTLEPGWYSIILGTGRHDATAPDLEVTLINTATDTTPQSRGPYSMNATTNVRVLQAATARFFVEGSPAPPAEPSPTEFLMETARPSAWWSQSFSSIGTNFRATRFEVTRQTLINEVGAWMSNGSGQVFAAIVTLDGPSANPLPITHPDFPASVVGSTLIDVAAATEAYSGDFDGLSLAPGHYALIFGSGLFGATGSANMMGVADQIVKPGHLFWTGSFWTHLDNQHFRIFLQGFLPELAVSPDPAEFSNVPLGTSAELPVTVTNMREDVSLQLSGIGVDGPGFSLSPDVDNCSTTLLGPEQSCQFTVRFTPAVIGPAAGVLQVWSDGEPSPLAINLTGNGFEMGLLATDLDELDFGDVVITTTRTLQFSILNSGSPEAEPLELAAIALQSGGPSFVINSSDCPAGTLVATGDSCMVEASFTPTKHAVQEGALSITTSDGQEVVLPLSGTVLGDVVFEDRFGLSKP